MKAKFFCKTGLLAGAKYVIDREARIGKEAGNHIVIDTKIVSGQHARIFFDDQEKSYFLEDLQSRNGTRLDGLRVIEKERLGDLHVITRAEKFDFIFQLAAEGRVTRERGVDGRASEIHKTPAPPKAVPQKVDETTKFNESLAPLPDLRQSGKTVVVGRLKDDLQKTMPGGQVVMPQRFEPNRERTRPELPSDKTLKGIAVPPLPGFEIKREATGSVAPAQKIAATTSTFFLEIKCVGKEAAVFTLKEGDNIVGRLQDCDIPIDDVSISRRHAVVTVKSKKVMVRDLGSKNRTFIGDREITDEVEIRLDSRLKFGAVEAHLLYKKG